MGKRIDLTNQQFGRWTVIRYFGPGAATGKTSRSSRWLVRCRCGTEKVTTSNCLRTGGSESCGCINRERVHAAHYTHGESNRTKTAEYGIWHAMITRCTLETHESYKDYGGRGITVCDRWRESYESFLADMGRRPSPKHSIERRDNDGNYEPGNCRWATKAEQSRNHRRNRFLTLRGRRMCVTDWAKELGVSPPTLTRRIKQGWSEERIFRTRKPDPLEIDLSGFIWPTA